MRKLACLLVLVCGVTALSAAETWRWRDADGVVHFSDVPVPGAERVTLNSAPKPGSTAPVSNPDSRREFVAPDEPGVSPIVPYQRCVITSPGNDQVFQNETAVQVTLDLQPGRQADHQILMLFDGQPAGTWDTFSAAGALSGLTRGTHTLVARVVDGAGRPLCISPLVSFHILLPYVRPQFRPR
ncbi:MAG: DUF4124 domain-containing protein [Nevskiaceae bacterium]|jgi:hypothetical protein|nr:DUF4124 domain-containing protein [Nevskiaceae bacterium]